MLDVFNEIKPLLKFDTPDEFYYLQILKRKKENPEIGSNSRVIKNYYVHNINYLDKHYDEIKQLCNVFNARAMLRLNRRSFKATAFKALQNIANTMGNGEYHHVRTSYDRACGLGHIEPNARWIIDIDYPSTTVPVDEMYKIIEDSFPHMPVNGSKILLTLPTKNGMHIITRPFDSRELKKKFPNIDIHKDNPINLYIS